jgi:hypothetical protein
MTHHQLPDFDELLILAKQDPARLEALRRNVTEAWIERAPVEQQRRLRGIQFQVDMEVRRAKNPMDACVRVSNMMHKSFGQLRHLLNDMTQARPGYPVADESTATQSKAQVLPFNS